MEKLCLPSWLTKQFKYHYSNNPILFFEPKTKNPLLKKGKEYWIAEKYRLTNDLIQYYTDYPYKVDSPKWIGDTKMRQEFSRYEIKVLEVHETNLQKLDKKQCLSLGIPNEESSCEFNLEKPPEFKKALEIWRTKQYWESLYESTWDDNPEILLHEFCIKRVKPKYQNYLDIHWYEKNN